MLSVTHYPAARIAHCRARFNTELEVVATTGAHALLPSLLIALDAHFVHRARGLEKKDGNPCNEVRMLVASWLAGSDVLLADKSIKYDPARAVLGIAIGGRLALDLHSARRLAHAFLADIEAKFGGTPPASDG
jgi:hypothetical protein